MAEEIEVLVFKKANEFCRADTGQDANVTARAHLFAGLFEMLTMQNTQEDGHPTDDEIIEEIEEAMGAARTMIEYAKAHPPANA